MLYKTSMFSILRTPLWQIVQLEPRYLTCLSRTVLSFLIPFCPQISLSRWRTSLQYPHAHLNNNVHETIFILIHFLNFFSTIPSFSNFLNLPWVFLYLLNINRNLLTVLLHKRIETDTFCIQKDLLHCWNYNPESLYKHQNFSWLCFLKFCCTFKWLAYFTCTIYPLT